MSDPMRNEDPHPARIRGMVAASNRLYRVLLVAYPSTFREEFGEEMAQVFRDACREAMRQGGPATLLRFWRVTLMDLAATAAAERLKEGFHMSRSGLVRLGGIALLIAAMVQFVLLAVQAAITLDFAFSFADPTGHSVVESPWIGRGEVATSSLGTVLPLLVLLGILGLHVLGRDRTGGLSWVAMTLVAVGFIAQSGASTLASALSWSDLSACINPRDCNIYDSTGMLRQATAIVMVGYLVAVLGLLLYGIATLRMRLLPHGNILPLLLVVASALPYLVFIVANILVPATDSQGDIRLQSVLFIGSLAVAIVQFSWAERSFVLHRCSRRPRQLPPMPPMPPRPDYHSLSMRSPAVARRNGTGRQCFQI